MTLAVIAQYSGLDIYIAKLIYQSMGEQFLTNNELLSDVFHKGGRYMMGSILGFFILGFVATLFPFCSFTQLKPFFGYMLLSAIFCLLVITTLKQFTTLPCPWDTNIFAGRRHYIGILSAFDSNLPNGHCYPSGHASGGFSLLGLYFWGARRKGGIQYLPNILWLLPAALIGTIFALTQQMRGAHYLSHDLTTIAICWIICSITLRLIPMTPKPRKQAVS